MSVYVSKVRTRSVDNATTWGVSQDNTWGIGLAYGVHAGDQYVNITNPSKSTAILNVYFSGAPPAGAVIYVAYVDVAQGGPVFPFPAVTPAAGNNLIAIGAGLATTGTSFKAAFAMPAAGYFQVSIQGTGGVNWTGSVAFWLQ